MKKGITCTTKHTYPVPVSIVGHALLGVTEGFLHVVELEVTLSAVAEQLGQLLLLALVTLQHTTYKIGIVPSNKTWNLS
jgi:hypothetical protein